jgi:hypothetical protein
VLPLFDIVFDLSRYPVLSHDGSDRFWNFYSADRRHLQPSASYMLGAAVADQLAQLIRSRGL